MAALVYVETSIPSFYYESSKFGLIKRVNTKLGLHVPSLVTPLELGGGFDAS